MALAMLAVLDSLLPVFLLMLLGLALVRSHLVPKEGWVGIERLLYYVAFPALIIESIARANLAAGTAGLLILTLLGAQTAVAAMIVALRPVLLGPLGESRPAFTSIVQGVVRWNALVALAVTGNLHGPEAVPLAAIGLAAMIPFANLVSVTALAIDGEGAAAAKHVAPGRMLLRQLATNPFILAVFVGVAISVCGLTLPTFAATTLHLLGQVSIATGLLVVGAGLDPAAAMRLSPALLIGAVLKLAVMPALAILIGVAVGLGPLALAVAAVCASVPTASASYVLARQMGGDAPLMARIIATQTLVAFLTMPVAIWAAGGPH